MSSSSPLFFPSTEQLQALCLATPSLPLCASVPSFYGYRLNIAANAAFLALFGLALLAYAAVLAARRGSGSAFAAAMLLGLLCEVLGYAGRVLSWQNQWREAGFLLQICLLTIAPAFIAAALYVCLRRVVRVFGAEHSRIPPEYYTRIFISCDLVSLVLQGCGGGIASVAFHNRESTSAGTNVMIAGLAFQVFTMLAFIAVSLDFLLRVRRRRAHGHPAAPRQAGPAAADAPVPYSAPHSAPDAAAARLRTAPRFYTFLAALALSTLCVLWRSVFRLVELSEGWGGPILANQSLFIAFEGVLLVVAVYDLIICHPVLCAPELFPPLRPRSGFMCCLGRSPRSPAAPADTGSDEGKDATSDSA